MKAKKIGLVVLAFFFVSGLVFGQRADFKKDGKRGQFRQGKAKTEDSRSILSEEQKSEMEALSIKYAQKLKPIQNELRELEAHQITLTTAPKPDLKEIYSNIDKISRQKLLLVQANSERRLATRSLLTEEQSLRLDSRKMDGRRGLQMDKRGSKFGHGDRSFDRQNQKTHFGARQGRTNKRDTVSGKMRSSSSFNEEQIESVKQISLEMAKEVKPFADQLRELRAAHITLITADKPEQTAISESLKKMNNIQTSISKIKAKNQLEIRSQLTEEQQIMFDKRGSRIHSKKGIGARGRRI